LPRPNSCRSIFCMDLRRSGSGSIGVVMVKTLERIEVGVKRVSGSHGCILRYADGPTWFIFVHLATPTPLNLLILKRSDKTASPKPLKSIPNLFNLKD